MCKIVIGMENVISVVGAAIVATIIGAFIQFERPVEISVPKPEVLKVVSKPKFEII